MLRAADPKPLVVREAKVIRVRDRQKGGPSDSYLEITSESGLKGYAGPLLKEQVAAFPANLRELLAGRDATDPEQLNFGTLWAACHPGKTLESYVDGKDPLTGAPVWGYEADFTADGNRLGDHGPGARSTWPCGTCGARLRDSPSGGCWAANASG